MADTRFPDRGLGLAAIAEFAPCGLCGADTHQNVGAFDAAPPGETDFGFAPYRRELWQCRSCGHVVNRHDMPLARLYEGDYAHATYGDELARTFDKIMALPAGQSDNRLRVERINSYAGTVGIAAPRRALDVGAGLGVFPAALAPTGWQCLAIEPDPGTAAHIRDHAGIEVRCGDFLDMAPEQDFDLLTLNKVLEHIPDPSAMLSRAAAWLSPRGVIYVELPDGEAALSDSPGREEFFVEHIAAYSMASLALTCRQAGVRADRIERLREPSGKYPLAAFMTPS